MKKILIANRGAAATRIDRAAKALGLKTVIVYSEADQDLPYVREAAESYCLGAGPAAQSYLNQAALLDVLQRSGADAVHPGYGFLSENARFARQVEQAGKCFIGPSWQWLEKLGDKAAARRLMQENGLTVGGSSDILDLCNMEQVHEVVASVGYPVLVKPAKGGGGIGMIPVHAPEELQKALEKAVSISGRAFSDTDLFVERFIQQPRHIEFQFLADRYGNVMSLHERDCSTQRRYQKVIEEAPAPAVPREELDQMARSLERVLSHVGYDVIGTVETLYSPQTGFSFLEVNTRLQVEHAITEAVTGVDIVEAQIRLAAGERLESVVPSRPSIQGHAIEARIYAENPTTFLPSPGHLIEFKLPRGYDGVRVETGYGEGCTVSSFYDPMVAKLVVHAETRNEAIARMSSMLAMTQIGGIKTNIAAIQKVLLSSVFQSGAMTVDAMLPIVREQK